MLELVLAAVGGYLVGSISFSRIVAARVLPDEEITHTTYAVGDQGFETVAVGHSPGAVAQRAGPRAGGLATLGDMAKAGLATGVAWLVFDRDAAAVAGASAVLGHVAPLYHGFRGAFGLSPIIGSTLVLSPLGLPAALLAANATAFVAAEMAWSANLWPLFLVLWGLLFSDAAFTWFAVAANVLWLWRTRSQLSERLAHRRSHPTTRSQRIGELLAMYRMNPYQLGLPQDSGGDAQGLDGDADAAPAAG